MTLAERIAQNIVQHIEAHTPGLVDKLIDKIEPGLAAVVQATMTEFGLPLIETAADIVSGKRDL